MSKLAPTQNCADLWPRLGLAQRLCLQLVIMKLTSQVLYYLIATFTLGYLLGYLTIFWTSDFHYKEFLIKNYTTNVETNVVLRHVHRSRFIVKRSVKDNDELPGNESHVMGAYSTNYLLVLYYFEQMNNALRNLLHLGPIAVELDLKIVEPFVVHSRLYGLPNMLPPNEVPGTFYSLHTLFNIDSVNQSLHSYANTTLAPFEDFVYGAPRDVVVVYFVHKERSRPRTFRLSYRYLQILKLVTEAEIPIVDCTNEVAHDEQIYGGLVSALLNVTAKYGAVNFRIVKFICVAGERDVTTDQLKKQLGLAKKTVIFPEWRGCAYTHCNLEMHRKYMTHSRPKLLYRLKGEKESPLNLSYASSNLVMETANFLIDKLNPTKEPYVSVYVRMEKLLKRNATLYIDKAYLKCCTSLLQKVLANIKKKHKLANVLLITDMGKYGSDSCIDGCIPAREELLEIIEEQNKIKMFDYDPSETPLKIDNSGFAAMVEMEMLAKATKLITVGPGIFKEQVARLYENRNAHSSVYSICKERGLNALHSLRSHC